jgi:4-amino-4-deoxy-L-arabinose transferase-like glycosyltransferase
LPLAWVGLVVLFFTLSTGKRGVYILPALPAMALAAGPALVELRNRKGPARAIFVTAAIIASILLAAGIYFLLAHERRSALVSTYGIEPVGYLLAGGLLGVVLLALLRLRRAYSAYAALVALLMLLTGYWINPVLNDVRSGRAFGQAIAQATRDVQELGLVGYREQYLLAIDRPTFNFGHRRTREGDQEAMDAARWLSESSKRALIVGASALNRCFDPQAATLLTVANRESWYLVTRGARADCVARGEPDAVRYYDPHRPPRLDAATRS